MGLARVVVLLLTVWLFAAAWSNDRPVDADTNPGHPSCDPPPATSSLDLGPIVQHHTPSGMQTRLTAWNSQSGANSSWMENVPPGVTPGAYLMVHSNGITEHVRIDAELLQSLGHDPDVTPQATHSWSHHGTNLTLVRLTDPAARVVIAEGPVSSRRY